MTTAMNTEGEGLIRVLQSTAPDVAGVVLDSDWFAFIQRTAGANALRAAAAVWDQGKKVTLVGEFLTQRADAIEAGEL